MNARWLAALLLLWGGLSGCRTTRAPLAPAAPFPRLLPAEVLELARQRVAGRQRLSTVVQVHGVAGVGRLGVTADLYAERPARLYVGARSFLGPPVDEIWTDGERFLWRSQRPGAGGAGPVTPQLLGALLPAPLPPSQWVGLALGLPLPAEGLGPARACPPGVLPPRAVDLGCVALDLADGQHVQLVVDGTGSVREARLRGGSAGPGTLHVVYADPLPWLDGLATTVALEAAPPAGPPRSATLRLTETRLNGPPAAKALFLPLERAGDGAGGDARAPAQP